jgi:carbonic anhydrase
LLCELNVLEQVVNVGNTTIVQDAWNQGRNLVIHGWIYDVADGLLKNLGMTIRSIAEVEQLQADR